MGKLGEIPQFSNNPAAETNGIFHSVTNGIYEPTTVFIPPHPESNGNNGIVPELSPIPLTADNVIARLAPHLEKERERKVERYQVKAAFTAVGEMFAAREEDPTILRPTGAGNVRRAIESHKVIRLESGIVKYTAFSDREDKHKYIGNLFTIESIMEHLRAEEARTQDSTVAILHGPQGSGKDTVVGCLEYTLAEYSDTCTPPLYGIKGCPTNESALHVLSAMPKGDLDQLGIPHQEDLCPDCQRRLRENGYDITTFEAQAVEYSVAEGRGILRLTPAMTKDLTKNEIYKLLRTGSGGIIEAVELAEHSLEFIGMFLEVVPRGNIQITQFSKEGDPDKVWTEQHHVDAVKYAHMTEDQFKKFMKEIVPQFDGARRRITDIPVRYINSVADEVSLYQSKLEQSYLDPKPHISPRTLELLAEVALLTRYTEIEYEKDMPNGEKAKVSINQNAKLAFYNGNAITVKSGIKDIELTQRSDRRKIELQSRNNSSEALEGLPPTISVDVITKAAVAEHQHALADPEKMQECLNPIDVVKAYKTILDESKTKFPPTADASDVRKHLDNKLGEYEIWLVETVKQAFRGDNEDAIATHFADYIENLELYVGKDTRTNPNTEEEEGANEAIMRGIEDLYGVTEANRKATREKIFRDYGMFSNRGKTTVTAEHFPDLQAAISQKVIGVSEDDINNIIISQRGIPDEDQQKKLDEVAQRLATDKHGFCACCAKDMLRHCADTVYKQVAAEKAKKEATGKAA